MPSPRFPDTILERSVKVAFEENRNSREIMLKIFKNTTDEELNDCRRPNEYKKLFFALCNYHAAILDRRSYC